MRKLLTLAAAALVLAAATTAAEAREFKVLASNMGSPVGVLPDASGRLFVPAYSGGANGRGSVLRLDGDGNATTLYDFKNKSGPANPSSPLLRDAQGDFYGIAARYGENTYGTLIYKISKGRETTLHFFADGSNGCGGVLPGLVRDAAGNFYGVSCNGGANGVGSVFRIAADGTTTVLHDFAGPDGRWPMGEMLLDGRGNLIGTTFMGGVQDSGTIFRIATTGGAFKTLHSFDAWAEGCQIWGGLVADGKGNLYGTANYAGPKADGTVFKLDASGKLTVLHAFGNGSDGQRPWGTLVRDAPSGALYGTTQQGGDAARGLALGGTVFKLAPRGKLTVLHAFSGAEDGGMPAGTLSMDAAGNLYGATVTGGKVFEITR